MQYLAYKSQTIQFLATLDIYDDTSKELSDPERAFITFKVDSVDYRLTLHELGQVMGFQEGGEVSRLSMNKYEAENVWETISAGKYKIGASKGGAIRHPAIRYAHKILAHTLFGRRENGNVKEDELALLIEGIKPYLVTCSDGYEIRGQDKRLNLSHFLVNRFLYYQNWVHTHRDTSPELSIGGLITPILMSVRVKLGPSTDTLERLDAAYLTRADFLVGRLRAGYVYKFLAEPKVHKKIVLPRRNNTRIDIRENILFRPRQVLLYDPATDGPSTAIPRYTGDQSHQPTAPEPAPSAEIYGSERYHFTPYDEPVSGRALQQAHHHIHLLQRWCKWQDKTIKKLVKTVKDLKKKVTGGSPSRRREVENETNESEHQEDYTDVEERHSYHGDTSTTLVIQEPARASAYERRPRRNKRKPTRSPSTSGSGNPSYSMDTSSSTGN